MNKKIVIACSMLIASLLSCKANAWFFDHMENHMRQMEKRMSEMKQMFKDMEQKFYQDDFAQGMAVASTKSTVNIEQKADRAIVNIELGTGIKNFDAKIKTKSDGSKKDQIVIETENGNKQKIVINVVGNYLSINKSTEIKQEKKTVTDEKANQQEDKKNKKTTKKAMPQVQSYQASYMSSSFSTGKTLNKKLDIAKAEIEYDEKSGMLAVAIPYIVEEENLGKAIDVKIKK